MKTLQKLNCDKKNKPMNELLMKIFGNPDNEKVLEFLKFDTTNNSIPYFKTWKESYSGFDEGGCIFFDNYGKNISDDCKYSLGIYSIMINKNSGEIFAFNMGRFSIFFKCDFSKLKIENTDSLRKGHTFDCITDITALGDKWCFMNKVEHPKKHLKWSFELTNKAPK